MTTDGPQQERGRFRLITLRSGSRAVQQLDHGEVMHPSMGPWAEAQRLYVEGTQLVARLSEASSEPFVVWDVGLGAGTNASAVLTAAKSLRDERRAQGLSTRPLVVRSFEFDTDAFELALGDTEGFSYLQPWAHASAGLLANGRYREGGTEWLLERGDFDGWIQSHEPASEPAANLVLFDPFSPKANPALWTRSVFQRLHRFCAEDCTVATYSASTRTRVSMLLGGFFVGAGPSTGDKGETTVGATRLSSLEQPLGSRFVERWERSSARAPHGEDLTPELEAAFRAHPQFR